MRLLLAAVLALSWGCRAPAPELTVLTYNIHHGRGLDERIDLGRIAAVIRASGADVVALQEVDVGVARTGRRDLPAELAALTGLQPVFGKNLDYQGGDYGNALLTRLPILAHRNHHYDMLRAGEQRGVLEVTLRWNGHPLTVLVTHLDYRRDDRERLRNAGEIAARIAALDTPVVLCGDLNDEPGSRLLQRLGSLLRDAWAGPGPGHTYPADQPRKRIDYVLAGHGLTVTEATVLDSEASDHRPLRVNLARARRP